VSGSEDPRLLERAREGTLTVEEVRALVGASTPHFALQLRERLERLLELMAPDHPAAAYARAERDRLAQLALRGEDRDERPPALQLEDEPPLPSLAA